MLLTITSTAVPASDLGFLLHKHPDRFQQVELSFGRASIFYPEATEQRCTVALLVELDDSATSTRNRPGGFALEPYVNPAGYVASSMLAVALRRVFGTAMQRRCDARPELVDSALPLTIEVPVVPADDRDLPRRLFAPLGWQVRTVGRDLDPEVPRWGPAPYVALSLTGQQTIADALLQLYVLLPVLGGRKHYWVGPDEVDKLLRAGEGWLAAHPERELIMARYLAYRRNYVAAATDRLQDEESAGDDDSDESPEDITRTAARRSLAHGRRDAVLQTLAHAGAHRVVDLGCGEGALLTALAAESAITEILGIDPSATALTRAERRLASAPLADRQRDKIRLRQSSAVYRDPEMAGTDAVVLMEVIEHLDPDRLPDLERVVFGAARPQTVIITTPDRTANASYPGLTAGELRHPDHRFEWDRAELGSWASGVAARNGYRVDIRGIDTDGVVDRDPAPSQLAVFTREEDGR